MLTRLQGLKKKSVSYSYEVPFICEKEMLKTQKQRPKIRGGKDFCLEV
jgi:hypothetical protein